jgi:hypothetical protein
LKITLLPHATEQMHLRHVSEEQVRQTVEDPDRDWPGRLRRIIAERDYGARTIRVIYNVGTNEAVVVTVVRKRSRGGST